jgi:hypothetical protein
VFPKIIVEQHFLMFALRLKTKLQAVPLRSISALWQEPSSLPSKYVRAFGHSPQTKGAKPDPLTWSFPVVVAALLGGSYALAGSSSCEQEKKPPSKIIKKVCHPAGLATPYYNPGKRLIR